MGRVLHALLVWVMAVAMPLQAMAASAMTSCGTGHGRTMQGPAPDARAAASAQASGPAHEAAPGRHGPHAQALAGPVASETAADAQAGGADDVSAHRGMAGCSACAACCPAPALPASAALPEVLRPEPPAQTPLSAPVPSHDADRLERPPRASLA